MEGCALGQVLHGSATTTEAVRHQGRDRQRFRYDSREQLRHHLQDFIDAYNFGRRLKTLKGLTPYEFICKR